MSILKRKLCISHGIHTQKRCPVCKALQEANYDANRRDQSSKAFYQSKAWRRLREQALKRDAGLCLLCGAKADVVDHIKEIKDGGAKLEIHNLQALCHSCHNQKSAKESQGRVKNYKGKQ